MRHQFYVVAKQRIFQIGWRVLDETERNGARMAKYSRQDILDMAEEEDIECIRLQFTDISGQLKNMATTVNQLVKILDGKCKFD